MASFLRTIKRQIDRLHRTREEYEEIIAFWSSENYLTPTETIEAMAYLDEKMPVLEEPQA